MQTFSVEDRTCMRYFLPFLHFIIRNSRRNFPRNPQHSFQMFSWKLRKERSFRICRLCGHESRRSAEIRKETNGVRVHGKLSQSKLINCKNISCYKI